MSGIHTVFGATGALGSAVVRKLVSEGARVRAVVRDAVKARKLLPEAAEIRTGDARDAAGAREAVRGATIVYHCLNVPYHQWMEFFPAATENILAASAGAGARLMFAGNVYGYGRFQQVPATEDHPRAAQTRKGKLRNELESRLLEAHLTGSVPVVIPRMPDFYGPNVTNKLYGGIFEAALSGKRAMWVGDPDAPHDLLYIEDAAAACIELAATDSAYGDTWHVPGAGPLSGRQFLGMIFEAAGKKPKILVAGRTMRWLGGLFDPLTREVSELLYLFEEPQVLDGAKFERAFPSFSYTSHREAVRGTLEWFRAR